MYVVINVCCVYRPQSQLERDYMVQQLTNMMTCDLDQLSAEQLTSWTYKESGSSITRYRECFTKHTDFNSARDCQKVINNKCGKFAASSIENGCHAFMMEAHGDKHNLTVPSGFPDPQQYRQCIDDIKNKVKPCLPLLANSCNKRPYRGMKLLRVDMDLLEQLINSWPHIKVLYLQRDPRGIITSRRTGHRLLAKDVVSEAKLLCPKMEKDKVKYEELKQKYSDKVMDFKYEQLADTPIEVTKKVYDFLQIPLNSYVERWMNRITHASRDGSSFSEIRANSSSTARAWIKRLSSEKKQQIDEVCGKTYKLFDYTK